MDIQQIASKVIEIIGTHTDTHINAIAARRDDLLTSFNIDSLDLVEIAMELEDEYKVEFIVDDLPPVGALSINKVVAEVVQRLSLTNGATHQKEAPMSNDQNNGVATSGVELALKANGMPALYDAAGTHAAELAAICHTANSQWWIDTETGEDVRTWPPKFFKLWVGTKIALCHSELSEALEGYRKDKMDEHLPHRKAFEVEMADALIRIGDLTGGLAAHYNLDIGGAVREKLIYNAQRLDHKHEQRVVEGGKSF